jgi:amino acid permease
MSESKGSKARASVEACQTTGSNEDVAQGAVADITSGSQSLHRSLRGKEVQLFAIGGAIGTCMSTWRYLSRGFSVHLGSGTNEC